MSSAAAGTVEHSAQHEGVERSWAEQSGTWRLVKQMFAKGQFQPWTYT